MNITKSYKVELNPNNKQKSIFVKCAGVSRFAYNWGLAQRIEEYQTTGKSSSAIDQHKQIVQMKKTEEYKWLKEVSKCIPQEALRNLDKAYGSFYRRVKRGETPGFPKFKSRHKGKKTFQLGGRVIVFSNKIKLPKIGLVRLKEKNRLPAGITTAIITCSEKANKWFASFSITEEIQVGAVGIGVLGLDLGIKSLAVTSDNQVFGNPRYLKSNLKKLAREQRKLSRRVKGSKNRSKQKAKVAKLHYKISNLRKDYLHKVTSKITKAKTKPKMIVMENLNVKGMLKNHNLSQAISDVGFYEFRRQIDYKCLWNNIKLVLAPTFFPSSKTCNVCGTKNEELKLSDRAWVCENCQSELDRDLNAAINLANYGLMNNKTTVSSTESYACGQLRNWLKQELNTKSNFC